MYTREDRVVSGLVWKSLTFRRVRPRTDQPSCSATDHELSRSSYLQREPEAPTYEYSLDLASNTTPSKSFTSRRQGKCLALVGTDSIAPSPHQGSLSPIVTLRRLLLMCAGLRVILRTRTLIIFDQIKNMCRKKTFSFV